MKVAVVYHYFAHYREHVFEELIRIVNEKESTIQFYGDIHSNEPNLNTYKFDNHKDKFTRVNNIWFGKFLWQSNLISKLFRDSPDTIIFLGQFNFISTWISAILFRLMGKRILFWGHGVYGSEKGLKRIVRDIFNRLPHIYMTYGEHAKELMVLSGIKESSISVIYNSLNVKQQEQFYEKLDNLSVDNLLDYHFDKTKTNIVFVGRLTKVKKIDLIFEALAKLGNRNYKLIIIGNGPEETHLKQAVKKLNLISMVTFMGEIHDESILSWLIYNSDICISPGNVGLTAMHSLVYGTPVITNNDFCHQMPEYEAIDEEKNGGFFEANNIESLAQKIEEWSNKILTTDRDLLRNECRKPILLKYNPKNQAQLIWECITKNVK